VSRDFEIRRGGVEDIDSLRPLWEALWSHHGGLPAMRPVRTAEDSWAYRSRQYREWLPRDEYTLLVAERDGAPIGYAVLSIGGDTASWDVGDKTAEIETLSVAESERGSGVGKALIDAVQDVADTAGAGALVVGVAHSNADAIRFYEREGFSDFYVLLMKP
jgi:ribosomal protein S18 acetylase RimI-like enzyme